ncbi:GNAT family N-acetyltransferase [Halomonas eurihalina]|uniref:GNAT family N-acetyltransferase n=1 Tax=Halomonas eurihalina TaxID=42566 RepID=A0A5D9DC99_HALER|nr:GNAT family N-acetyltransferase [Halomonas eurihalina]MDR5858387.1 GNAT family N-acetyltransferase [Halomonas eurihalina]TZG41123.1 GNAT family N-acetyltransferase [Halomonas eurihalina]
MPTPQLTTCQGAEIVPYLEALADLRIRVFRDYPYLYDGDPAYEADYLKRYADNSRSLFVLALDGERLIGAATAQPLADELEEFRAPFEKAGYRVEDVFYYGESVLLPGYRGAGLGHAFMDARERHAAKAGFTWVAFCAVERPDDHPRRPADYRPLHDFWQGRGYRRIPELATSFSWKDLDDTEETAKPMVFWLRETPA